MKFGGHFPLQSEQSRFSQVVNAGVWETIADAFSGSDDTDNGGGGGGFDFERDFFDRGGVVQVDERSFGAQPGTEFLQSTSGLDRAVGTAAAGLVGGLSGIPGVAAALRGIAGGNTVRRVDAAGNPINTGAGPSGDNNAERFAQAQAGGTPIANQASIPTTVNQQGQLVDNSGNLVNQQGQRIDENGRLLSEPAIAIADALARQEAASGAATQTIQGSTDEARQVLVDAALASQGFVQQGAADASTALTGGLDRSINVGDRALERALGIDTTQTAAAQGFLSTAGANQLAAQRAAAAQQQGFLTGAADQARGFLTDAAGQSQGFLADTSAQGIAERRNQLEAITADLDPFISAGTDALSANRAFLGLGGAGAQQAAFDQFIESPGQTFLREQGEQAALKANNAAGGIASGQTLQELNQFGQGFAATRLDDRLNRLTALSSAGQNAATNLGGFRQGTAGGIASDLQNLGVNQAGIASNLGLNQSNIATQLGLNQANVAGNLGSAESGIFGQQGVNQANLAAALGARQSGQVQGLSAQQQQLINANAANQANIASGLGTQQAGLSTGLSGQQSNLISAAGTNIGNLQQLSGEQQASAILGARAATATQETNAANIAAQQAAQSANQDQARNTALLGLAGSIAQPFISSLF